MKENIKSEKDKIKERKSICRLLNKNINTSENLKQNKENCIIFMGISNINIGKLIVLNQLLNCNYKFIIGIDNKKYKNDNDFNNDIKKNLDYIKKNLDNDLDNFLSIKKTYLDNNKLIKLYGNKIENFNGRWKDNPSKLGSIDWFNKSEYEYMWYLEDDVYCKNYNLFFDEYCDFKDDIICKETETLPFWCKDNWRIGNKDHCFTHYFLCVTRYSKQFSNKFFKFLKQTKNTTHHELFIAYVLNYYHLNYRNLLEKHRKELKMNGGKKNFYNLSDKDVNKNNAVIFHPFKIQEILK